MTQRFDADLGAYQMDHRDYEPVLKRFHTPGTLFLESPEQCLSSPHECNLYSYSNGNFVNFVDPIGKNAILAGLGVAATAYGVYDWFKTNVPTSDSIVPTGSPVDYAAGAVGSRFGLALAEGIVTKSSTAQVSGLLSHESKLIGREIGPTVDSRTGHEVGRFIGDAKGNVMIEPLGGKTVPAGRGDVSTHTLYPNGSNYQRLDAVGHGPRGTPHGHGHLEGIGTSRQGQGASIDRSGNPVPAKTREAHWPIN